MGKTTLYPFFLIQANHCGKVLTMTYRISPSDVHLIMSLCLLEMDHHLD